MNGFINLLFSLIARLLTIHLSRYGKKITRAQLLDPAGGVTGGFVT